MEQTRNQDRLGEMRRFGLVRLMKFAVVAQSVGVGNRTKRDFSTGKKHAGVLSRKVRQLGVTRSEGGRRGEFDTDSQCSSLVSRDGKNALYRVPPFTVRSEDLQHPITDSLDEHLSYLLAPNSGSTVAPGLLRLARCAPETVELLVDVDVSTITSKVVHWGTQPSTRSKKEGGWKDVTDGLHLSIMSRGALVPDFVALPILRSAMMDSRLQKHVPAGQRATMEEFKLGRDVRDKDGSSGHRPVSEAASRSGCRGRGHLPE